MAVPAPNQKRPAGRLAKAPGTRDNAAAGEVAERLNALVLKTSKG